MRDLLTSSPQSPKLAAREERILEHIGMVRAIARRIQQRLPRHVPLDDLISTGVVGLIQAVDAHDPGQNTQLSTYADYRIRGAILDSLRREDCLPRHRRKRHREIEEAIARLQQALQRNPTEDEIAAELGISIDVYYEWIAGTQGLQVTSIEAESQTHKNLSLLEFVPDSQDLPSALVERAEMEEILSEEIRNLPPMERTVLSLYYERELAPQEIARVVALKSTRVSQIRCQAIARLRESLTRRLRGKQPRR